MKIPGFTAEAAIYDTGAMYGMTATPEAPAKGAVVAPQQTGILCNTFLNRCVGPVCIRVRCCAIPPNCCLRVTVFGATVLNRCFP
jgi:hypothetical protein